MNKICIRFSTMALLFIFSTACFGQETKQNEESNSSKINPMEFSLEKEKEVKPTIELDKKVNVNKEINESNADSNNIEEANPERQIEQDKIKKYEIGLHYSNFNFGVFDPTGTKEWGFLLRLDEIGVPIINQDWNEIESGIGARFTYNFNKNIAVESEINWYPRIVADRPSPIPPGVSPYQGGQKLQMVFGPKIGYRNKKIGVFGKARPGFMHFVEFPVFTFLLLGKEPGTAISGTVTRRATFFNVDVGGVFEYYPSKRTVLRFDIGDTIIRYYERKSRDVNPGFTIPGYTRHNLQINIGAGFRF
ncbi:hypothetical protein BH20ACI4_BH20ACI4_09430 [soil metagenome]